MYFDKQEFMVMHKCSAYYASIMLNAFRHLLCSLLCQHNWRAPTFDCTTFFTKAFKGCTIFSQLSCYHVLRFTAHTCTPYMYVNTVLSICHTAPPVVFDIATNAENNDIKITWKVRSQ